jgi:hypothetical protein
MLEGPCAALLGKHIRAGIGPHRRVAGIRSGRVEHTTREPVDHRRITARDVGDSSDSFVAKDTPCFLGGQLMVNKRWDFVCAELVEANARDEQALREPGAESRFFQPGEEFGRCKEYYPGYPVIANPRGLVEMVKDLLDVCVRKSVCVVEYN